MSCLSLPLAAQVDLNRALSEGLRAYESKNYDVAVEKFSSIVNAQKDAPGANVLYLLGFSHYFKSSYQDAANTFLLYLTKYKDTQDTAEVQFYLGRSLLQLDGKADEALKYLGEAAKRNPEYLEDGRFLAAEAYIKKGDKERAAQTLLNAMKGNASGPGLLRATIELVDLYIEGDNLDEAVRLLKQLEQSPGYADVIATVNNRFVQIGDRHLEAKAYAPALEAYSSVRPRSQVIAVQTDRVEQMKRQKDALEKRIADATKKKEKLPMGLDEKVAILDAMVKNTETILGEMRKAEDYDAIAQMRVAKCFFNMGRFWPASVAFEAMAEDNPKSKDVATPIYGALASQWQLGRTEATRKLCDRYMELPEKGPQFDQVAELKATLLLKDGLYDDAIAFLGPFLEKNPQLVSRQNLMLMLANAKFEIGKYDAAAADYDKLKTEFPNSPGLTEEYVYRRALCDFNRNDYKATIKSFEEYEKAYPAGQFTADIRYRRGIIQLALKDYDGLTKSMTTLLNDPRAQEYKGQIYTLLGDAYQNNGENELAAEAFANAVRFANGDQKVIEYSLEQATNMLRGARKWDELQKLWQDFLKENPNHPMKLRGVGELSKLLSRSKKIEEARTLLGTEIKSQINNVRSEYVEMLISQLVGLHVPPRQVKKDAPKPNLDENEAALLKDLEIKEELRTPAYVARILFAKSELGRMAGDQQRNELNLNAIANTANPVDLGPILLSIVGDYLFDKGDYDRASPLYTRLRQAFPQSPFADAAPVGLGRIAMAKKEYEEALKQFDFAINKGAGTGMLKEATFGRGQALRGLKRREDAKKAFESIVGTKEWRGFELASALYELGEIEAESGDRAKANFYFQKVYTSWKAFPDLAAKAYIRSAEMFKGRGETEPAIKTLRELLKDPKLQNTPEAEKARKLLQNWE